VAQPAAHALNKHLSSVRLTALHSTGINDESAKLSDTLGDSIATVQND
jgi:hypothetical protein